MYVHINLMPGVMQGFPMTPSLVLTGLSAATMAAPDGGYGLIADAAIVLTGDRIAWVGPRADLPTAHKNFERRELGGRLVTPALIDCHTHIVHGGNRAREFEMRLEGASYEQIARAGGGIVSTVAATRSATEDDLLGSALPRVEALIAQGVAVIEVK